MTLDRINQLRDRLGRCGALFCILFLLAAVDGLSVGFRQPGNLFNVLRGESVPVNGSLKEDISDVGQLTYSSSTDGIKVVFEVIHSGFWLGGKMWRGLLSVSSSQDKGEYLVTVHPLNDASPKASTVFRIHVYPDADSMRRDAKSIIQRYLGVSPWLVFGLFLPLALATFLGVFYLSQRREQLMTEMGMADVYHVVRGESGFEISFALGTLHGLEAGSRVLILDKEGNPMGEAVVQVSTSKDSTARVELDCPVTPSHMVMKIS